MQLLTLFISFLLATQVYAKEERKNYRVEGRLASNNLLAPEAWKTIDINQIQLELKGDFEQYHTFARKNGSFVFFEVPAGSYLLKVLSAQYIYPMIRVDISSKTGTIKASRVADKSIAPYPLKLEPEAINDYFMVKEGFKITSLFMNPMMIMIGVSVVFIFLIPRVMGSLDEETLKELQGNQQPLEPPPKWTPAPIEQ